jgi:hypothetical protein
MTGHHPSSVQPTRQARDWLEVAIEWASGATAVGMFAYGFALSYAVLHAIAAAAGLAPWAARVWPLGFESFMASAALNALAEQRHRRHLPAWHQRVPWYPWTLTALTAGASLLLNWFHPAIPLDPPPGWLRSLVYGLPPLAAVFAWHLFLQRLAHRRHPAPAAEPSAVPVLVPAAGKATTGTVPTPVSADGTAEPGPVPAATGTGDEAGSSRPRPTRAGAGAAASAELAEQALTVAAAFQAKHGRPISRDALRRALHVSNRVAGELLHAVRAPTAAPPPVPAPPPTGTPAGTAPTAGRTATKPSPVPVTGPAGNGHRPDPGDQPASASPSLSSSSSRSPVRVP